MVRSFNWKFCFCPLSSPSAKNVSAQSLFVLIKQINLCVITLREAYIVLFPSCGADRFNQHFSLFFFFFFSSMKDCQGKNQTFLFLLFGRTNLLDGKKKNEAVMCIEYEPRCL